MCLIRAGELFGAFFRHRMGEEMPLSFLQDAQLLLIDDLGTEPMTQNVTTEYLFDLLNRRIEAGRHTAVATNVEDLQARYGERISSRLESVSYTHLDVYKRQAQARRGARRSCTKRALPQTRSICTYRRACCTSSLRRTDTPS